MNKPRLLAAFILILMASIMAQLVYLKLKASAQEETQPAKEAAVRLTGLPDLALSTEARFVRHRSLADISTILSEGGSLPEYFPSAHLYAVSPQAHASGVIRHEP